MEAAHPVPCLTIKPSNTMKTSILAISAASLALFASSCSTTTVVKPEPTTVSESVRRTSTSNYSTGSAYGAPAMSSSTETRSVTAQ